MKKIFLLVAVAVFASCSSDDDSGDVDANEFEHIKTTLVQGEWKVTTLIDGADDKTTAFESFVFNFKEDGSVIATTDLFSENGIWSYDNTTDSVEKLIIHFEELVPFEDINDDWEIVSVSSTKVELRDKDDDDGELELLTFTKI